MLLVITLTTDNPVFLSGIFIFCFTVFNLSGCINRLINGLVVFIPFFFITVAINFIFVQQGAVVLFTLGGRHFTLEALLYAIVLSSKLLMIIYIFQMLGVMVDSDRAVSYFSSVLPKSTLTFMIALKLFPLMEKRLATLKETYSIRGVDFEGSSIKKKLLAYKPVLSVLLEDSLEKSFDIGEAVFVRGFLGSKRTVYDRQQFKVCDYLLTFTSLLTTAAYLAAISFKLINYNSYDNVTNGSLLNSGVLIILALFVLLYGELIFIRKRLVIKYELY